MKHKVGLTKFFDLTMEEFRVKYTGLKVEKIEKNEIEKNENIGISNDGSYVDHTSKISPIKDQRNCGSCYAFSSVAAVEFEYNSKNQLSGSKMANFSEQEIIDCSTTSGNLGCQGGSNEHALSYMRDNGLSNQSSYPYTGIDSYCKAKNIQRVLEPKKVIRAI